MCAQQLSLRYFFAVTYKLYFFMTIYQFFIVWESYLYIICFEKIHSSFTHLEFLLYLPCHHYVFSHKCAPVLNTLEAPNMTECSTVYYCILEKKNLLSQLSFILYEEYKGGMPQWVLLLPFYVCQLNILMEVRTLPYSFRVLELSLVNWWYRYKLIHLLKTPSV